MAHLGLTRVKEVSALPNGPRGDLVPVSPNYEEDTRNYTTMTRQLSPAQVPGHSLG